jgi:hypothetical protein
MALFGFVYIYMYKQRSKQFKINEAICVQMKSICKSVKYKKCIVTGSVYIDFHIP